MADKLRLRASRASPRPTPRLKPLPCVPPEGGLPKNALRSPSGHIYTIAIGDGLNSSYMSVLTILHNFRI